MMCLRRRTACWLVGWALLASQGAAAASDSSFPFGSDLILDTAPMRGSKRVPMIQIEENGSASIDLWCASNVPAQATVGDNTFSIVVGAAAPAPCPPERQTGDDDLLNSLAQVTGWRRHGELIELSGPTTLRFRLMTN
jgi:hypothetical protein